jgi:hypothetical protein
MTLTEKEEKIARLALDKGARDGERQAAAIKLVESMYERGVKVEDFATPPPVIQYRDIPVYREAASGQPHETPLFLRWVLALLIIGFLCWLANTGPTLAPEQAPEQTLPAIEQTTPRLTLAPEPAPEQTLPTHGHGPGTPTAAQVERWRYLDQYAKTHSFSGEALKELDRGAGK